MLITQPTTMITNRQQFEDYWHYEGPVGGEEAELGGEENFQEAVKNQLANLSTVGVSVSHVTA